MGAFKDRLREIFPSILCPHCGWPVYGDQPAVERGTIVAHRGCYEEYERERVRGEILEAAFVEEVEQWDFD